MINLTHNYEKELLLAGQRQFVGGIDEAGRGSWAGPVVAACVLVNALSPKTEGVLIMDSKILSPKEREISFEWLIQNFVYGVGVVSHELIDAIGIVPATKLAMKQAVEALPAMPEYLLIDAVDLKKDIFIPQESHIKGDSRFWSIAAASIVAKVTRDRIMCQYGEKFPVYGFEKHKGYGTALHCQAIGENGLCEIHRRTYKLKISNFKSQVPNK